ncbi:MAG: HDOD domain-containing protein [Gammaproteobacteria bacterium]
MTVEKLVFNNIKLVSLPEICLQLQEQTESPSATAESIGKLVSTDAALSARLLQLVNSAFYGINRPVDTITRAVNLIGMRELKNLAYAASVTEIFADIPDDIISMSDFWQHSAYCGIVARHLAKHCNILHNERLFTVGLLHDVGRLLMCMQLPQKTAQILEQQRQTGEDIIMIEDEVLGYNHAEVGAQLLEYWNMSRNSCASVKYHHSPQDAHDAYLESALLNIANITAEVAKDYRTDTYSRLYDPYGALLDSDINVMNFIEEIMEKVEPCSFQITNITQEQIIDSIRVSAVGFSQILEVIYPIAARELT